MNRFVTQFGCHGFEPSAAELKRNTFPPGRPHPRRPSAERAGPDVAAILAVTSLAVFGSALTLSTEARAARARFVASLGPDKVLVRSSTSGLGTGFAVATRYREGACLRLEAQGGAQCPGSDASGQTKTLFACT